MCRCEIGAWCAQSSDPYNTTPHQSPKLIPPITLTLLFGRPKLSFRFPYIIVFVTLNYLLHHIIYLRLLRIFIYWIYYLFISLFFILIFTLSHYNSILVCVSITSTSYTSMLKCFNLRLKSFLS